MKSVIYSCLTGGYDILAQPEETDPSFDFVCFSDSLPPGRQGVWEIRPVPRTDLDQISRARYPKLQPHRVLPEYDCSIFMDANLCITGKEFYDRVRQHQAAHTPMALLEHPLRDCVYDEVRACFRKDKITARQAFAQYSRLKRTGMPRHAGLYETNVVFRFHHDEAVRSLDDLWWETYRQCSTRDQLTLTPALFQTGFRPALLLGPGLNARNVSYIRYTRHPLTGKENTPGRLTWGNIRYRLRLWYREFLLLFLR